MKLAVMEQINSTNGAAAQTRFSYGLNEIAEMTGLSTAFLRKEARAGNLKTKKFGARRLVLNEDLTTYLKGETNDKK